MTTKPAASKQAPKDLATAFLDAQAAGDEVAAKALFVLMQDAEQSRSAADLFGRGVR
jgi:hypothetical protein